MKYLQDYQEHAQTELLNKLGGFFAFGNKQFKEGVQNLKDNNLLFEGEKLTEMGAGLYAPSKNKKALYEGLASIYDSAISQDIKENGKDNIIIRELYNHECFYTYDITDAIDKLKPYGFTTDDISTLFAKEYLNYEKHNN